MLTGRKLMALGWPEGRAIGAALRAAEEMRASGKDEAEILRELEAVRADPDGDVSPALEPLAREFKRMRESEEDALVEARPYAAWGEEMIEAVATEQMRGAMRLPITVAGALMPDAHLGYGLPVGGVLATKGAVIPWAVGVDIAPLRGDTQIPTLDGKSYAIKDLCERDEDFGVWSCKPDGKIVAARARAFQTRKDARLVKVTIDNGRSVECTPDHRFMLRDGTYLEASSLVPGTSLMPFYSRLDKEGYMRVRQNYSEAFLRAHWIVARSGLLGKIPRFDGQKTAIHHINFDETDNRPENLRFMGDKDHSRFHRSLVERNIHWQSEEFERKRKDALSAKKLTAEGMDEYRKRADNLRAYWVARPEKFDEFLTKISENNRTPERRAQSAKIGSRVYECGICGKEIKSVIALASHHRWKHAGRDWKETYVNNYNHKVVKVEELPDREDVYCLEVPRHHNFALDARVFVHNCRMKLSVFDVSPGVLDERPEAMKELIVRNTNFGAGGKFKPGRRGVDHEVLEDEAWSATPFLKKLKSTADAQLGTSGSGNHFVEWGVFEATAGEDEAMEDLEAGRRYLALLSHSGSRGVGARIADRYSKAAKHAHPRLDASVADLAWLDTGSEAGEEYWLSMELAGRFASANHAVIHAKISAALAEESVSVVENHHNFCIAGDQLVPTTLGPKRMDEVEAGDMVYAAVSDEGLEGTRVEDVWLSGYERTCGIHTDSRRIRCTANHEILSINLRRLPDEATSRRKILGTMVWKRAGDLSEGDIIVCADGYYETRGSIGIDNARLLGAMLGDGWIRSKPKGSGYSVGFAIGNESDTHISKYLALREKALPQARWHKNAPGAYGLTCSSKAVYTELADRGFSGNGRSRKVPDYVYTLPRREKLVFLAGYIDADGSVSKNPRNRGRTTIASTNKELAQGIREIAVSCALRVTPVRKESRNTNYGSCIVYRCVLSAASAARLDLWHEGKAANLNGACATGRGLVEEQLGGVMLPEGMFAQKIRRIKTSSVAEPVYDLSVEHESHSFVCSGVVAHNCWREEVTLEDGSRIEAFVHRKGAAPAGAGVLGVIPGSMGDAGYVVRGKGAAESINSASHGAGRTMSRTRAFATLDEAVWRNYLEERGVILVGGGLDEAPMAYKPIDEVMARQRDLVDVLGSFTPRIVRMDGSQPRRKKPKKGG